MQMLLMISLAFLQDPEAGKVDLAKTKLFFYDAARGITLRIDDEGAVDLTVKEKGGAAKKTFTARNAEAFRKAYPDEVRRYDLGRYLGGGFARGEFEDWWERQKRSLPDLRPWDREKWKEQQEQLLEDLRRRFQPGNRGARPVPMPRTPEFGVKVEEPEETLREQLGLGKEAGVLVTYVKPGSTAEKAGVKRFDIFLALDGERIADKWAFRKDVLDALSGAPFELETVRGGKKITIRVDAGGKK